MPVKVIPKFTKADIRKMLLKKQQAILDAMTLRLQRVGEQFVARARNNDTYKDQTGNLRSSIGYVILYNGEQLSENFEGERDGVLYAKRAVADIKHNFPKGFVLIGVAGMDYAAAVEAKGFDVITASSLEAQVDLKKSMEALIQKLKNS